MSDFVKATMIDGVDTFINVETVLHIDCLSDYLNVHFTDETVMSIKKEFLNLFINVKPEVKSK